MRAAHTNSAETVRVLVESGDGIGKRDEQGRTALMHAAKQGHVEPARLLVEKEKGLQDRSGWTALMHAVHNNHPGVVEILAARECGKTYGNGRTVLMIAAERGYAEIVAAFAPHEKGLADSSGNTALMLAASNAHTEAVRVLAEYERGARDLRGRTALVLAARAGHREAVEILMEHEKDITGWTMLMCAAALGDVDMVSQHIDERGQKDKLGRTALILGAWNGQGEVVRLLMVHEGDVSSWTSLICAAYLGDVDAVKNNLHEKGRKDVNGRTALMWTAHRRHTEVVRILVEEEGGMQRNDGWTALMVATYSNKLDCVRLLAEREKDTKSTHEWYGFPPGTTALNIAKRMDYKEIVPILSK